MLTQADVTNRPTFAQGHPGMKRLRRRLWLMAALGGGVTVLLLIFQGTEWVHKKVYPFVLLAAAVSLLLVVPACGLLALSRKRRGQAAAGLLVSSQVLGFSLWMWSVLLAFTHAGLLLMVAGLVSAGLGPSTADRASILLPSWVARRLRPGL